MFRLGLTGSIATGKSTALDYFSEMGVPVFSADAAVHELYSGPAVAPVEALFPGVANAGVIDRRLLGERVVRNPEMVRELEAIVHPLIFERVERFLEMAEQGGSQIAVVDIPLLFESDNDYQLDAVAVTHCSDAEQRRRALSRPGMTEDKLNTILARQMPQAEKVRRADFVIETGGTLQETRAQVAQILAQCREMLDNQPE